MSSYLRTDEEHWHCVHISVLEEVDIEKIDSVDPLASTNDSSNHHTS